MKINRLTLFERGYPERLKSISSPPQQIYVATNDTTDLKTILNSPCVAIVGSRKITPYGRQVTAQIASKLASQGVVIISGLAFGVDRVAHEAALSAGGTTVAVLPGPVQKITPSSHTQLGQSIVDQGGALLSEYEIGSPSLKQNFVARNRIVSGLSHAVLITEAAESSGSLHTAKFAVAQGKPVLAVPGDITQSSSFGSNNLIKSGNAKLIQTYRDVLVHLGIEESRLSPIQNLAINQQQQVILDLLRSGRSDPDEILAHSGLTVSEFNKTIASLEIDGLIRANENGFWTTI